MTILTLKINLDDVEVNTSEDPKYSGYVFFNPKKGRSLKATGDDGKQYSVKMHLPPVKAVTGSAGATKTTSQGAQKDANDALATALTSLAGAVGNINARLNDFEARLPLKSGRKGVAAPGISSTNGVNGAGH